MSAPRLELKFLVTETTALVVRDYVRAFLDLDRYVTDRETFSYFVDSLYLDSNDLQTFWAGVNGSGRRYKLRVRTYDDRPASPVFLEVKRCIDEKIIKERAAVRRSAVEKILSGWLPDAEDFFANDPEQFLAAENFVRLMLQLEAKPKAFVRYLREPWVGRDDPELRLTLDRNVGVSPKSTPRVQPNEIADATRPFHDVVVLELKFRGAMPAWFPDLARICGLRSSAAAKYCEGILMHDLNEFNPVDWPDADPSRLYAPEVLTPTPAAVPSLLAQIHARSQPSGTNAIAA